MPQTKLENQSNTIMASGQLPSVSDQNTASMTSSESSAGGGTSTVVPTEGAVSGIPSQEGSVSLASLLPVSKVSQSLHSSKALLISLAACYVLWYQFGQGFLNLMTHF